jgi:hypothetical protein
MLKTEINSIVDQIIAFNDETVKSPYLMVKLERLKELTQNLPDAEEIQKERQNPEISKADQLTLEAWEERHRANQTDENSG